MAKSIEVRHRKTVPDRPRVIARSEFAKEYLALSLLHAEPGRAWTVDVLAREAGLSRSALAERFTNLVGESPIQYLTRWRLTIAAQRLRNERASLASIAADSGYDSEAAFNRAFKRALGATPAAWRRDGQRSARDGRAGQPRSSMA